MKNSFKLGILALVISVAAAACGGPAKTTVVDSTTVKVDTTVKKDTTVKVDTTKKDTTRKK